MDIKSLEEFSRKTKIQAETLLQSTQLLDILHKFGNVHLIGSYPLDVMYGADIDIIVESKNIQKSSVDALHEIVDKGLFRKVEYGDFVKFPIEKRPKGYILVLKAEMDDVKWEIEVWFLQDTSKSLSEYNFFKSKITKENRIKILEAKHRRKTSNTNKHTLSSFEIYEQILGKVTS